MCDGGTHCGAALQLLSSCPLQHSNCAVPPLQQSTSRVSELETVTDANGEKNVVTTYVPDA